MKEGRWRKAYLWFDGRRTMHVFLCGEDESVENDVLGLLPKQGTAGVHVYWCSFDERLIPLLRIFSGGVAEKS